MRWIIFPLMIFVVLSLAACSGNSSKIELELYEFEFGDVVNGTLVGKDIRIKNQGAVPLEITSVSTSCGCTMAEVDSPTIQPGASGTLQIEFDSGAHGPDMTGELMRQVFVESNDPDQPMVTVTFTVNVIK